MAKLLARNGLDLDPDVRQFIRTVGAGFASFPGFEQAPPSQQRKWAEEVRAPWTQGGPAMRKTWNLDVPTRHGNVRVRIHKPAAGVQPVLVYLHGGGWTVFSIDTHDRVMREYAARSGCAVLGVDYALSPERKFPTPLEQVGDVIDWVGQRGVEFEIDARKLAIGGDSAGGNLSIAACLRLRDAGKPRVISGMLLNYGAFSTETSADACARYGGPEYMLTCREMAQYWRNYQRTEADASDPLMCPLLARLEGLPPAFLTIPECDILAEQSLEMAQRLRQAGVQTTSVVYPGASHSFLEAISISSLSARALAEGSAWLARTLD
jgi:acetyl esterase